jgi:hypothetical protein
MAIYLISYLCFVDALFVLKHHDDDLKKIETCWNISELYVKVYF